MLLSDYIENVAYFVMAFLLGGGTYRNRLEIQLVKINKLGSYLVKVYHEVAVVLIHNVELSASKLAYSHLVSEHHIDIEDVSEGQRGLNPVHRFVKLVSELYLAVPQNGPEE